MSHQPPNHLLYADISDYQAGFDARSYARSGRKVVMIKAGEGTGAAGAARWAQRTRDAHAAGLRVIHYLFARLDDGPAASIDALLKRIAPEWDRGDRMLIDIEQASGPPDHRAGDWLQSAQHRLTHHHDAPPAIAYTDEAYASEAGEQLLNQAPWWAIAAYDGRLLGRGEPVLPGKAKLLAKQYTDGTVGAGPRNTPGVGACDSNILTHAGAKHLGIHGAGLRRRVLPTGVWL